jgi:protein-arginine kinase activator protein McsA
MNEFFDSLYFNDEEGQTKMEKEQKWNQKLIEAIQSEDYEAAGRIRDYMKKHNLKKY